MTTPRKHWFKVEDSILREAISPEDRGIIIGLVAFANQRWARDGLTPEEACLVPLASPDLHLVTGRERSRAGLARLRQALRKTSATISQEDGTVLVKWPKLAEIQAWDARPSGKRRPRIALSETQDADADARGRKEASDDALSPGDFEGRVVKAARILGRELGSPDAKLGWMRANLERLEAEVERMEPEPGRGRSGAFRSLALRWYKADQKTPLRSSRPPWEGLSERDEDILRLVEPE